MRMQPPAPIDAITRLLDRYRHQTEAVGGLRAGERFDQDRDVRDVRAWLAHRLSDEEGRKG